MKKDTYFCDVCGVERKEANHWFVARRGTLGLSSNGGKDVRVVDIPCLSITGWNRDFAGEPGSVQLCGQACVHKFVDEFLSK